MSSGAPSCQTAPGPASGSRSRIPQSRRLSGPRRLSRRRGARSGRAPASSLRSRSGACASLLATSPGWSRSSMRRAVSTPSPTAWWRLPRPAQGRSCRPTTPGRCGPRRATRSPSRRGAWRAPPRSPRSRKLPATSSRPGCSSPTPTRPSGRRSSGARARSSMCWAATGALSRCSRLPPSATTPTSMRGASAGRRTGPRARRPRASATCSCERSGGQTAPR